MNKLREAAEVALDAMDDIATDGRFAAMPESRTTEFDAARDGLRAALAEPVQEPPSAIDIEEHIDGLAECWRLIGAKEAMRGMNMYGPQDAISERGLRKSEIEHRRAIRAALKEKNHD